MSQGVKCCGSTDAREGILMQSLRAKSSVDRFLLCSKLTDCFCVYFCKNNLSLCCITNHFMVFSTSLLRKPGEVNIHKDDSLEDNDN